MHNFNNINQSLAHIVLKEMLPESKFQLWFQSTFLKVISRFANKEKIMSKMLSKMMLEVDKASNLVELKDYRSSLATMVHSLDDTI